MARPPSSKARTRRRSPHREPAAKLGLGDVRMSTIQPAQTGTPTYQIFPFFTGTDGVAADTAYLLPPVFTYGKPIATKMSLLYLGGRNFAQSTVKNADFTLTWSQVGSNVVAHITLTGTNMWAAAAPKRAALMGNFVSFLQEIETKLENPVPGLVVPGATFRIAQQIADLMPAPLLETLFYRYSFSPGIAPGTHPYVDVRPGMQLRVESEASQFLAPSSTMNGYVTNGAVRYFVNTVPAGSGRAVVLDPFLGTIRAPLITAASTSPVVAGGLPDLLPVGGAAKWVRLFYPQQMGAPGAAGDITVANNPVLVAALTLEQINQATASYPALTSTPANVQTVFLGRAAVVPEIPVWINLRGQSTLQYVPVGTTLANIVERYTVLPLATPQQLVTVTRLGIGTWGVSAPLSWNTGTLLAFPSTMFDLPLIGGDNVSITF